MDSRSLPWLIQRLTNLQTLHDRQDYSALTNPIAQHLQQIALQAFTEQRSPDGEDWKPLAASTIRERLAKGHPAGPILVETGALKNSIVSGFDKTTAYVGSTSDYAGFHQFGGLSAGYPVAARPFLGLGNPDAISAIIDTHLAQAIDW